MSAKDNSIFRRAQSLRFPRASAPHHQCASPSSSSPNSAGGSFSHHGFSRTGSRNYRSKSSRQRYASIEAQSLLGRMSASQRLALCCTWRQIRNQQTQVMRKVLAELEQSDPLVKEIFCKATYVDCFASASPSACVPNLATLDEHIRLLTKFFDELVAFVEAAGANGMEGGEEITAMIKRLGQQHAILSSSFGLSAEVWEKLGEIAMEKICSLDAIQRTREAGRAWRTLIAFMTDKLRCGFEGEAKVFSRRPSVEQLSEREVNGQCEALGRRLRELRTDCGWTEGSTAFVNGREE